MRKFQISSVRRRGVAMVPLLLTVLLLPPLTSSHKDSAGLRCTNDFVNNISCTWDSSLRISGGDCRVSGERKSPNKVILNQSCELKRLPNSPPGCSFVFEGVQFSGSERLPRLSLVCNGTMVQNIPNYKLRDHIKMHRPSAPKITSSVNGTSIWWTLGRPVSYLFKNGFSFELQRRQSNSPWSDEMSFFTPQKELHESDWRLSGRWEFRVRVVPKERDGSHWSDWSPTATWMGKREDVHVSTKATTSGRRPLDEVFFIVTGIVLLLFFVGSLLLIFWRSNRRSLRLKPVPNPSKYFRTLHSVHEGDLRKWLNPLSLPESVVMAQPCNLISPVQLCEDSDLSLLPSSSSTCGLLHQQSPRPSESHTSGVVYHSSSLSSYSNMGYFMSSSSGASAQTNPSQAYFTYDTDGSPPPFLFALTSCPSYKSLKREPNSPDSGFGFIGACEGSDMRYTVKEEDQSFSFLALPQNLPSRLHACPDHPDGALQTSSRSLQQDAHEAAGSSVCRSSSMPTETCKSGYLTLKEMQATFSNKSI